VLGRSPTLEPQEHAWRFVADELARRIVGETDQLNIWTVAGHIGKEASGSVIAEMACHPGDGLKTPLSWLPHLLGPAFALIGEYIPRLLSADLRRQEISDKLEKAVEFRCVPHPSVKPAGDLLGRG
jgi:hypothetical protein